MKTLTAAEQDKWSEISGQVKAISTRIESLLLSVIEADVIPNEDKLALIARLNGVELEIGGLAYLCTPQSEWLGGESWAVRPPHIARKS